MNQQKQSGMVLILAILIIGAVIGTVSLFSNLIIRNIQQSRLIDNSIQAYYLAESGSEKALHQVRRRQGVIDCSDIDGSPTAFCQANGFCSNDNEVPCVSENKGTLAVSNNWKVATSTELATNFLLAPGESFQIDLFNPVKSYLSNVDIVELDSSTFDNMLLLAEFTNITNILDIASQANCISQPPVVKDFISLDISGIPTAIDGIKGVSILEECSYSLRLDYLVDTNSENPEVVIVTVADGTGNQIPIPGRIIIDAEAEFGDSSQRVRVRTPIRPPVSGLLDFVVFSEERIIK